MFEMEIVRSETHKHLKVDTRITAELGYGNGAVMVLPNEVAEAHTCYPLVFRKHPETGKFHLYAMCGFEENENLFLHGSGQCRADYLPLVFSKGPFVIGFHEDESSGVKKPVLSVDMNDSRVKSGDGERIFNDDGSPSKYLSSVNQSLYLLDQGINLLSPMLDVFSECHLIEPLRVDLELNSGKKITIADVYTVSEEVLQNLSADALYILNTEGFLAHAFYIADSLRNIKKLVAMRNEYDSLSKQAS